MSVSNNGSNGDLSSIGASISADGRYVTFTSFASNLVRSDTNGFGSDVFVYDRQTRTTELVSLDQQGLQFTPGADAPYISANGRYVVFTAYIDSHIPGGEQQVVPYLRDRHYGISQQINVNCPIELDCERPHVNSITPDGRYLVFNAGIYASNVFVHDRQGGETELISTANGLPSGHSAAHPSAISADGRYVVFSSSADNLVDDDMNRVFDIFIRDRLTRITQLASVANDGTQGNNTSFWSSITPDGRFIVFSSDAFNLVPDDTNFLEDVFVRDLGSGNTFPGLYLPFVVR